MHETTQIKRLREMAARRGWAWLGEPGSGFCGRLRIGDRVRFVIGADLGVNSAAAARIARDKAFAQHFLAEAGLPTISTRLLHALADAEALTDFPMLLKPHEGHGGAGISVACSSEDAPAAYALAREVSRIVLAQPVIRQREFRVVVFNRLPLLAYEKKPLTLVGDGSRSITELLNPALHGDVRVLQALEREGLSLATVLPNEQVWAPLPIANLKAGGSWRECLAELSPALLAGCVAAADCLGLVMAGIDLFAESPASSAYLINEVNATPGLECLADQPALLDPLFNEIERYIGPVSTPVNCGLL